MRLPRLHTVDRAREEFRIRTAPLRKLPGFVVIGAQKAGTSTLYNLLIRHPQVGEAERKEIHYFDTGYERGVRWYRSRFPFKKAGRRMTGEASPYYLYHPHAPRRMRSLLPEARLIALLRNPVDRAYSHYQHNRRHGREPLPFQEAIAREPERLEGELERMIGDPSYYSFAHQHYSYLDRGGYHEQLERFTEYFSREKMLVLKSERFFQDTAEVWREVLDFLDLDPSPVPDGRTYNAGSYSDLDSQMRHSLMEHFQPGIHRLARSWGGQFEW